MGRAGGSGLDRRRGYARYVKPAEPIPLRRCSVNCGRAVREVRLDRLDTAMLAQLGRFEESTNWTVAGLAQCVRCNRWVLRLRYGRLPLPVRPSAAALRRGDGVKALSLWQPHAAAISVLLKPWETRDWATVDLGAHEVAQRDTQTLSLFGDL